MSLAIKAARAGGRRFQTVDPRGDPGLFGAIGGALRGGFTSLISGGNPITGAVAGGVRGFRGGGKKGAPALPRGGGGGMLPVVPAPGVTGLIQRFAPGGSTGLVVQGPTAVASTNGGGCPSGSHPNKSDYFLRDGSFVPKGSRCVKNRRRNPMNPKALDRAISRVDSGKRLQSKLAEITTKKFTAAGHRKAATC